MDYLKRISKHNPIPTASYQRTKAGGKGLAQRFVQQQARPNGPSVRVHHRQTLTSRRRLHSPACVDEPARRMGSWKRSYNHRPNGKTHTTCRTRLAYARARSTNHVLDYRKEHYGRRKIQLHHEGRRTSVRSHNGSHNEQPARIKRRNYLI